MPQTARPPPHVGFLRTLTCMHCRLQAIQFATAVVMYDEEHATSQQSLRVKPEHCRRCTRAQQSLSSLLVGEKDWQRAATTHRSPEHFAAAPEMITMQTA